MKIGFTGTRFGMSDEQRREFIGRIQQEDVVEFHQGCCIGADEDAFDVVKEYARGAHVVAHPPINRRRVCRDAEVYSDEVRPAVGYLERNCNIAKACDKLYATPAESEEQRDGGTWHTIRQARRFDKPVTIIWPDGTVTEEVPEGRLV